VQVFNNGPGLPPFGDVELPLANTTWFGNCEAAPVGYPSGGGGQIVDPRYLMRVTGWALDTGAAEDRGGVSHVRVEIDGVSLLDSRLDCRREALLNYALVDCYGYYRPDIDLLTRASRNPEFRLLLPRRRRYLLAQAGFTEGAHILQVKAYDKGGGLDAPEGRPDRDGVRELDEQPAAAGLRRGPDELRARFGGLPVQGWPSTSTTSGESGSRSTGVVQIDAQTGHDYADTIPQLRHRAALTLLSASVRGAVPFYLDTTKLSNSEHDLTIEVQDGQSTRRRPRRGASSSTTARSSARRPAAKPETRFSSASPPSWLLSTSGWR